MTMMNRKMILKRCMNDNPTCCPYPPGVEDLMARRRACVRPLPDSSSHKLTQVNGIPLSLLAPRRVCPCKLNKPYPSFCYQCISYYYHSPLPHVSALSGWRSTAQTTRRFVGRYLSLTPCPICASRHTIICISGRANTNERWLWRR